MIQEKHTMQKDKDATRLVKTNKTRYDTKKAKVKVKYYAKTKARPNSKTKSKTKAKHRGNTKRETRPPPPPPTDFTSYLILYVLNTTVLCMVCTCYHYQHKSKR